MRFDILSIFPGVFEGYTTQSILKRAQEVGAVSFHFHDVRDWADDRHRRVDDTPYGGGAGMVMKVRPFDEAVSDVLAMDPCPREATRVILFSAKGADFTQRDAERLATGYKRLIFLCGRYEGVDERVADHVADEEMSIGPYVLTGGELPALVVADAVTRLLPNVLGNPVSLEEESHGRAMSAEYPQYTRPEEYRGWKVPEVLLGGNHAAIRAWRDTAVRSSNKPTVPDAGAGS